MIATKVESVKTLNGRMYRARIMSGYRADSIICHGATDTPIHWPTREACQRWLTDTGYTVRVYP